MAGVYIHIPFCRQKCNYCNFFSLATTKFRDEFHRALLKEIDLTRDYLRDEPVETIYFGGGTPSLFSVTQLQKIVDKVKGSGVKGQGGRVKGQGERVKGQGGRVKGQGGRVEGQGGRVEGQGGRVEGQGGRVKGQGGRVKGQGGRVEGQGGRVREEGRGMSIESSTANCQLPTANCPLPTANCLLPTANYDPQEITLEMNPDDVTPEYLEALSTSAINRVSLGIQSFFDEDLTYLSRSHDARQAIKAVEGLRVKVEGRGMKIGNLSVDLIYGIPTLSNAHWKENLKRVIDLGIPHLSAYALTVEPKTALAWQIRQHPSPGPSPTREGGKPDPSSEIRHPAPKSRDLRCASTSGIRPRSLGISAALRHPVSDDQSAEQFDILMDTMERAGYIQYEISNFCLPGYESKHNSNYWRGIPYLGLGPSAHSYNGSSRRWNISNLSSYIRDLTSGILSFEEELLTPNQKYNEYVLTSLRTINGASTPEISTRFGPEFEKYFRHQANRYLESGHLETAENRYRLTRQGKFLADGIAADLFAEE